MAFGHLAFEDLHPDKVVTSLAVGMHGYTHGEIKQQPSTFHVFENPFRQIHSPARLWAALDHYTWEMKQ